MLWQGNLRQRWNLGEASHVAQTVAEAKTAISSWWLDMVFPEEHVAPRCWCVASVIPDTFLLLCLLRARANLPRSWQFIQQQEPEPGSPG